MWWWLKRRETVRIFAATQVQIRKRPPPDDLAMTDFAQCKSTLFASTMLPLESDLAMSIFPP
jgi:hypothetical protein